MDFRRAQPPKTPTRKRTFEDPNDSDTIFDDDDDDYDEDESQEEASAVVVATTAAASAAASSVSTVVRPKSPLPLAGDIAPKRKPNFDASTGKYLKPPGRRPKQTKWNEDRGVWSKVVGSSSSSNAAPLRTEQQTYDSNSSSNENDGSDDNEEESGHDDDDDYEEDEGEEESTAVATATSAVAAPASTTVRPKSPQPIAGDIAPKRKPNFDASTGKYLKPPGRRPQQTEWNEDRGVWSKVVENRKSRRGAAAKRINYKDADVDHDDYLYKFYEDYEHDSSSNQNDGSDDIDDNEAVESGQESEEEAWHDSDEQGDKQEDDDEEQEEGDGFHPTSQWQEPGPPNSDYSGLTLYEIHRRPRRVISGRIRCDLKRLKNEFFKCAICLSCIHDPGLDDDDVNKNDDHNDTRPNTHGSSKNAPSTPTAVSTIDTPFTPGRSCYTGGGVRTKIVRDCLHRFCNDCIEKALRVGNRKECPICRTVIPSRRCLAPDAGFDDIMKTVLGTHPKGPQPQEQEEVDYSKKKAIEDAIHASSVADEKGDMDDGTLFGAKRMHPLQRAIYEKQQKAALSQHSASDGKDKCDSEVKKGDNDCNVKKKESSVPVASLSKQPEKPQPQPQKRSPQQPPSLEQNLEPPPPLLGFYMMPCPELPVDLLRRLRLEKPFIRIRGDASVGVLQHFLRLKLNPTASNVVPAAVKKTKMTNTRPTSSLRFVLMVEPRKGKTLTENMPLNALAGIETLYYRPRKTHGSSHAPSAPRNSKASATAGVGSYRGKKQTRKRAPKQPPQQADKKKKAVVDDDNKVAVADGRNDKDESGDQRMLDTSSAVSGSIFEEISI